MVEQKRKWEAVIGPVLGVVLLLGCLVFWWNTAQFKASAVQTTAVVTEIEELGRRSHRAHIRFQTEDGYVVETELGFYAASLHEGREIPIYYDADNPQMVLWDQGLPMLLAMLSVAGMLLAAAGALSWYKERQ